MSDPSVLVVGAGALGLASAWHLVERGASKVRIVDREYPASGSSGLSVGIVQTQHLTELNVELRAIAMRFFDRLTVERGLSITRNGYLRIGFNAEQMAAFERSLELQHQSGILTSRILDRADVHRLIPDMTVEDVCGALYGPRDGYLDGHLYCGLLAEMLAERGVELWAKCAVLGAEERSTGGYRVFTERGEIDVDVVVNAAGAWASHVGEMFGTSLPLRPERHQAVMARLPAPLSYRMPCVTTYAPGSGREGVYLRHERPAELVLGLHSLEPIGEVVDPDDYRRSNDLEYLERVAEEFSARFPGLGEAGLGGGWAGIYPMTEDGLPIVGPSPGHPPVINAVGAGGAGIMLSPAIGRLVSEWILDGGVTSVSSARVLSRESAVRRPA